MGCGCLVVLLGTAFPRVALLITAIFTGRIGQAFDGWALPVLGWLLLPYTTFFYVVAYAPVAGVTGIGWFFVVFGFILDISAWSGAGKTSRDRYAA